MKSLGGNQMNTYFENFLVSIFSKTLCEENRQKKIDEISKNESTKEFRKILDRMAKELIETTFDNERLKNAMLSLPKIGRIVLTFQVVLDMDIFEVAYLLNTTSESASAQKYKAINKLREYMNNDL